jgi:stearoyl-CoA desaturase (delta-9 desaturase)
VAIHRQHHRFTDREGDPHSPAHGFARAQWLSMYHDVNIKYAVDLIRDKFHVFLHQQYFLLHLIVFVFWLLIDPMLLVACYLAPAALLWEMGSFINTINHKSKVGNRNFDTSDNSRNVAWLGYLMWGEGWHNNHHHKANDPKFGVNNNEFDMGWFFIKRLQNVEKA